MLVTTVAVAVVAHEVIGLPWAVSFALGAIVSPTDPVAATAILQRVGAPRRIVNIIEGESLVNDATALVAYKVAVAAAVGGSVSAVDTVLEFFGAVAGGVAIGLAVGYVVAEIRRRINDPITAVTISLLHRLRRVHPRRRDRASRACSPWSPAGSTWVARAGDRPPEARMQGVRPLVGAHVPAQRDAVHPHRAAAAGDRRRRSRGAHGAGGRIRGTDLRGGDRGRASPGRSRSPYLIRAIDRRPQQRARRSSAALAGGRARGRDARGRLAGGRAGAAARRPTPGQRCRAAT